jgi:hypothetical protein
MKTPITITAIWLDAAKVVDRERGNAKISVEIDGRWIEVINVDFDPDGFHISHIVEGAGIAGILSGKKPASY